MTISFLSKRKSQRKSKKVKEAENHKLTLKLYKRLCESLENSKNKFRRDYADPDDEHPLADYSTGITCLTA